MKTFDLVRHIPSNRYFLLRYCRPDYSLGDGYKVNSENTNYWLWSLFKDKVGGVFAGSSMELIEKRFSFKWWFRLLKIII
jgi:hypothetical protein